MPRFFFRSGFFDFKTPTRLGRFASLLAGRITAQMAPLHTSYWRGFFFLEYV